MCPMHSKKPINTHQMNTEIDHIFVKIHKYELLKN